MAKTIPIKKKEEDPQQVIFKVLQKFQDAYTQRDVSKVDSFLDELFIRNDSLQIIGTGQDEWCVGCQEARELFVWDWEYWGDLKLDLESAEIHNNGEAGWLTVQGFVHKVSNPLSYQKKTISTLQTVLDQELTEKEKLLSLLREVSEVLYNTEQGEDYYWPIRLSAVLVRRVSNWYFQQLHFSFPTTRLPDERLRQLP